MIHTIEEIKARSRALNKKKGGKPGAWWFSAGNMRFFSSRVSSVVFPVPSGAYFITSARQVGTLELFGRDKVRTRWNGEDH